MIHRVPVLLVTGFLGSGKTTFINWILEHAKETKISLILNEFGDIKLESQLISQTPLGTVAELANGCMCCVARDDIPRIVNFILDKSPDTEQIIIEASGLSDPDPVALVLQEGELAERIQLDTIVAIVDGLNFRDHQQKYPIVMSQIADADLVVISKLSELDDDSHQSIVKFFRGLGVGTRVIEWNEEMSERLFLGAGRFDPNREKAHHHDHFHDQVNEVWIRQEKPLEYSKVLSSMRNLPLHVIRAKGVVNLDGKKHLLQFVGNRLRLTPDEWGNEELKHSAILFLGVGLQESDIQAVWNPEPKEA